MQVRIPAREIDTAWPDGLHALFLAHGVKLLDTDLPHAPESVSFTEPWRCWWDQETRDLVIEQS